MHSAHAMGLGAVKTLPCLSQRFCPWKTLTTESRAKTQGQRQSWPRFPQMSNDNPYPLSWYTYRCRACAIPAWSAADFMLHFQHIFPPWDKCPGHGTRLCTTRPALPLVVWTSSALLRSTLSHRISISSHTDRAHSTSKHK